MEPRQRLVIMSAVLIGVLAACQGGPLPASPQPAVTASSSLTIPVASPPAQTTQPLAATPTVDAAAEGLKTLVPILLLTAIASEANNAGPEADFQALRASIQADPNIACAVHPFSNTLTCLNSDGWRVYHPDMPVVMTQCPDGRAFLMKGEELFQYTAPPSSPAVEVLSPGSGVFVACGPGRQVWVASGSVVRHFDGQAWESVSTQHNDALGYAGYSLHEDIAVAPNGSLWVTTNENIATFDGMRWQLFGTGKGYQGKPNSPRGLVVDAQGTVWEIEVGSLRKYAGGAWSEFDAPQGFFPRFITLDPADRVWVAGDAGPLEDKQGTSLYTFDRQTETWARQFDPDVIEGRRVAAMRFDRQGRLWLATDYGLYVYDGSRWIAYHTDTSDLYSSIIETLYVLGDGPRLPALAQKAPGAVSGKIVDPTIPSFAGLRVELCPQLVTRPYKVPTPCEGQGYHALANIAEDGSFLITGVPAGRYYLYIQVSPTGWRSLTNQSPSSTYLESKFAASFEVRPATESALGEIKGPP